MVKFGFVYWKDQNKIVEDCDHLIFNAKPLQRISRAKNIFSESVFLNFIMVIISLIIIIRQPKITIKSKGAVPFKQWWQYFCIFLIEM